MSAEFPNASKISDPARNAFQDLKALGYDIEALGRRNMNDDQILELRDKAFKFRGIEAPAGGQSFAELVRLFELGVGLSLRSPPDEAKILARHVLYLAEQQLSEY